MVDGLLFPDKKQNTKKKMKRKKTLAETTWPSLVLSRCYFSFNNYAGCFLFSLGQSSGQEKGDC